MKKESKRMSNKNTPTRSLVEEIRGITTIDLAFKANNVLEKILWIIILLLGTVWASYFITVQFRQWVEHPSIITKEEFVMLSDIDFPVMTICSKVVFHKLIKPNQTM